MTSESERGLGTVLLCLVPSGVNLHNAFAPGVYLQVVGSGYFTQPVFVPSTGAGGSGGSNQSNLVPMAPSTTLVASPGQQPYVLLQPVPQNQFNGNGNQQYIYSQPWIATPLSVEQPQYQRMSGNDSPVSLNPNAQTFYPSYYTKHLADFKGGYAADGSGMVIYNGGYGY